MWIKEDLCHLRVLSQNKFLPVHQVGDVCCRSFDRHLFHLCTAPLSLDSEPSLPHLMEKVAAVIPHKYEMVGFQLSSDSDNTSTKDLRTTTEHLVRCLVCGRDVGHLLTSGGQSLVF